MALLRDLQLEVFRYLRLSTLVQIRTWDWTALLRIRIGIVKSEHVTLEQLLKICSYAGQVDLPSLNHLPFSTVLIAACHSGDAPLLGKLLQLDAKAEELGANTRSVNSERNLPLFALIQYVNATKDYPMLRAYLQKYPAPVLRRLLVSVVYKTLIIDNTIAEILLENLATAQGSADYDMNAEQFLLGYLARPCHFEEQKGFLQDEYLKGILASGRSISSVMVLPNPEDYCHVYAVFNQPVPSQCNVEQLNHAIREAMYYFSPVTFESALNLLEPEQRHDFPGSDSLFGNLIAPLLAKAAPLLRSLIHQHYPSSSERRKYDSFLRAFQSKPLSQKRKLYLTETSRMALLLGGYIPTLDPPLTSERLIYQLQSCTLFCTLHLIPNFQELLQRFGKDPEVRLHLLDSAALSGNLLHLLS